MIVTPELTEALAELSRRPSREQLEITERERDLLRKKVDKLDYELRQEGSFW